jgi:hypothetical protein
MHRGATDREPLKELSMKKFVLAAALGATMLTGAAVATQVVPAAKHAMRGDTNGDGAVTRAEMLAQAEARFVKADANKDGKLSGDELKFGKRFGMRGHHRGAMGGRMLERFDADKDGTLSVTERATAKAAMDARMLERFDADKDGTLSDAERATARAKMQEMRGKMGDHRGPPPPPAPKGS